MKDGAYERLAKALAEFTDLDFFGTAYGQSSNKFEGFKLGDSNVQLDDTLLLIEPDAAKAYEAAHPPVGVTPPGPTPPVPVPPGPSPPGPPGPGRYRR
jgi:hypothetical protein